MFRYYVQVYYSSRNTILSQQFGQHFNNIYQYQNSSTTDIPQVHADFIPIQQYIKREEILNARHYNNRRGLNGDQ